MRIIDIHEGWLAGVANKLAASFIRRKLDVKSIVGVHELTVETDDDEACIHLDATIVLPKEQAFKLITKLKES